VTDKLPVYRVDSEVKLFNYVLSIEKLLFFCCVGNIFAFFIAYAIPFVSLIFGVIGVLFNLLMLYLMFKIKEA